MRTYTHTYIKRIYTILIRTRCRGSEILADMRRAFGAEFKGNKGYRGD